MLAKASARPVMEWNYKGDAAAHKHISPMAQDFQAAFGLNSGDDQHLSVADESGVALAVALVFPLRKAASLNGSASEN